VDAAIELMNEHHLDVSDVESVIAGIASVVKTQTGFEYKADSVLNAQMSLSYNIAVAIFDRQVYLEQFTNDRIVDPQVFALVKKIQIEIDPDIDRAYPEIYGGKVDIITKSGKRFSRKVNYSRGMPENPMSQEDIERKFMSLATAAVGLERAANILTLSKNVFDAESVDSLNALLTQPL
jgi:2-methylcitrate dehydratase PrpD